MTRVNLVHHFDRETWPQGPRWPANALFKCTTTAGSRRTPGYFTGTSETSSIANTGDKSDRKVTVLQVFNESPLTDSNRRPPPYHGADAAACFPRGC
jgi:hypothetical protein